MPIYPTELQAAATPLPDSVDQAELNARDLYVLNGLDMNLASQLVSSSRQAHLDPWCLNDPTSRFGDLERVVAWQSKGRLSLPLVRRTGEGIVTLAGMGWMGPGAPSEEEPEIPGAEITFALRLYEEALGQGNALPYTQAILGAHDTLYGNHGVWLETWGDNEKAVKTYLRAGFQKVAEVAAVRKGEEHPRVYMTLGTLAAETA